MKDLAARSARSTTTRPSGVADASLDQVFRPAVHILKPLSHLSQETTCPREASSEESPLAQGASAQLTLGFHSVICDVCYFTSLCSLISCSALVHPATPMHVRGSVRLRKADDISSLQAWSTWEYLWDTHKRRRDPNTDPE